MEDKLVKYHHKAIYYYFKKAGICFSIFVGAFVAVAIPVSVAAGMRNNNVQETEEHKTPSEKDEVKKLRLMAF